MRIGFVERRERSRSQLSPSQAMIASRFVWLPSMTMCSGRPWRYSAFFKKRFAARRSRCSLNQNSTESPTLSMARNRHFLSLGS